MITYTGRNNKSDRIVRMYNEHIVKAGIEERRYYIPLILGALQKNMIKLLVTKKILETKATISQQELEAQCEYHHPDYREYQEMSTFSYKLNIFITALLELSLPEKFLNQLLEELIREMEEVNDKIREIVK